ncbi:hypothetical protein Tco_0788368 [Tanacetum coccineum]
MDTCGLFYSYEEMDRRNQIWVVRFINVFNVERLVNNFCSDLVVRCKTQCQYSRFNRDQKNGNKYKTANQKKHEGRKNTFYDPSKEAGTFDSRNSFVNVLKGTNMVKETDSSPVIVLEEDCVGSWFLVLRQASHDFTPEGRIAWVDVEGIPFKFWSGAKKFKKIRYISKVHWIRAKEATGWIPEFSEDEEDDDHSEQEFISSEQSDLGLHIDGEDNGASEVDVKISGIVDGAKTISTVKEISDV